MGSLRVHLHTYIICIYIYIYTIYIYIYILLVHIPRFPDRPPALRGSRSESARASWPCPWASRRSAAPTSAGRRFGASAVGKRREEVGRSRGGRRPREVEESAARNRRAFSAARFFRGSSDSSYFFRRRGMFWGRAGKAPGAEGAFCLVERRGNREETKASSPVWLEKAGETNNERETFGFEQRQGNQKRHQAFQETTPSRTCGKVSNFLFDTNFGHPIWGRCFRSEGSNRPTHGI